MYEDTRCEQRLVEQAMAFCRGREAEVVDWLIRMGCQPIRCDGVAGEYQFMGLVNVGAALYRGASPLDTAINLGFLIGGEWWAAMYPRLLDLADKAWKEWRKERKAAGMAKLIGHPRELAPGRSPAAGRKP
jgi:hypothetical protein